MKNLHLWLFGFVAAFFVGISMFCPSSVYAEESEKENLSISELTRKIAAGPAKSIVLVRTYKKDKKGALIEDGHGSGIPYRDPNTGRSYVLTAFHVPKGDKAFSAVFLDQPRPSVELRLLGYDEKSDGAVLTPKDPSTRLPNVRFGDSDKLYFGMPVFSVGYPEDLRFEVFAGQISNPDVLINGKGEGCPANSPTHVVSDARIAGGNSGGPLFNERGEVVALNSCVTATTSITISTPINYFTKILPMLERGENVRHPMLGMMLRNTFEMISLDYAEYHMTPPEAQGIVVVGVPDKKSPAARAGIIKGDIILGCDGVAPLSIAHFLKMIYFHFDRRKPMKILILRGKADYELKKMIPSFSSKESNESDDDD